MITARERDKMVAKMLFEVKNWTKEVPHCFKNAQFCDEQVVRDIFMSMFDEFSQKMHEVDFTK